MILTFLSGLAFVDTLLPLRKLPNKVDIKLFEEEFEGWLSCWFELVDVGSAEEGRDEGQMLCLNCCNLDVFRDVILWEPELIWEFEWFLICMGVVFGGLYELKCGFLLITVMLLLIWIPGVAVFCDMDKCGTLLLIKLASIKKENYKSIS